MPRHLPQAYGLVGSQPVLLGVFSKQFDALAAAQQHQWQQEGVETARQRLLESSSAPAASVAAGSSVGTHPTQQPLRQQLQMHMQLQAQQQQHMHPQAQQQQAQLLAVPLQAPVLQQQPAQHGPAVQQAAAGAAGAAAAAVAAANAAVVAAGGSAQPGPAGGYSALASTAPGQLQGPKVADTPVLRSSYADLPGLQAELNCAAEIVAVAAEAKHRQQQALLSAHAMQGTASLAQPSGLVSAGSIPSAPAAAVAAGGVPMAVGGMSRQGMVSSYSCLDFSAMSSLGSGAEPMMGSVPNLRSKSSFDAQQLQAVQQLQQQHSLQQLQLEQQQQASMQQLQLRQQMQQQQQQQQVQQQQQQQLMMQVPAQQQQVQASQLQPQLVLPHLPAQLQMQPAGAVQQVLQQQEPAQAAASQLLVQQMQAHHQQHQHQQLVLHMKMEQQQVVPSRMSPVDAMAAVTCAGPSSFTVTTEIPVINRAALHPATSAGYPAAGMSVGTVSLPAASSAGLAGISTMPSVGPPAAAAQTTGVVVGVPAVATVQGAASLVSGGSLAGPPAAPGAAASAPLSGATGMCATPALASSSSVGPPIAARNSSGQLGAGHVAAVGSAGAGGLPESRFQGVQWSVSERRWQAFWLNKAANEVSGLTPAGLSSWWSAWHLTTHKAGRLQVAGQVRQTRSCPCAAACPPRPAHAV
jgi:hypothetical protein